MDLLPRLHEVERERTNAVAVRCESDGEVARRAWVKENALGLLPAEFTRLLT